jgi:outer membrane protein
MRLAFSFLTVALAATAATRLTLEEAVATAHKNNPRLSVERIQALIGEQTVQAVRSGLFPTIAANATAAGALDESRLAAGALNNPIIFSRMAAGVSFSQLLTDFGRTANLVEGSRLRSQSQREAVLAAQALLTLAVHRSFFAALRAKRVMHVAEQTVQARTLALEQASALAKSGLRSTLDAGFAEVNLSEAKLALLSAVNDYQSLLAELSMTMGYMRPQEFDLQDVLAADSTLPPVPKAEELIGEAFRTRPDANALRLDRDALAKLAAAEHKLNMPVLSALGNAGVAPVHDDRLRNRFAAAGVNLNIPVFNGGLFKARQQEADLRVQAAEQRLRDLETRVANEIVAAVLAAQTAFDRVDLTAKLLQQATSTADLARERYNLGLGSIVELSQAELNQTAAAIRAAAARYDYLLQRVVVDYQSGKLR